MLRELPYVEAPPEARRAREVVAALLRVLGAALERFANALTHEPPAPIGEPVLEFHAEAGAPEGALYVDGQLVGTLSGVNRL
jgi:hypothetical protein